MNRLASVSLVCAVVLMPLKLSAQLSEGGRFELGAFASYNRFDATRLQLSRDYGVGVRAGWFLTPMFSVEGLVSRTHTRHALLGESVVASEIGATALATVRAGGYNQLFLGAGYSWLSYSRASGSPDYGVHLVVGDRIPLSRMAALRLEGRATRTSSSNALPGPGGKALSVSITAGVSLFLNERPPRDSDDDVVPDRFDACASTPAAAVVDATGCPRDTDGDRLYDGLDRCPGTPTGVSVDGAGCALDGDRDGVPDHLDRCAGTEFGLGVGAQGCPPDADGDGVFDHLDGCAQTPGGAATDAFGCPLDSDTDGVPDYLDRCEATPLGARIDDLGCTVLFEERQGEAVPLVLRGVNFDTREATLTADSYAVLEQVASSLIANEGVRVEVAGHTDDVGTEDVNLRLSIARAETVRDYLASRGIAPERLVARGYGTQQPVASNATEAGRAQNRRVELRLIEQ